MYDIIHYRSMQEFFKNAAGHLFFRCSQKIGFVQVHFDQGSPLSSNVLFNLMKLHKKLVRTLVVHCTTIGLPVATRLVCHARAVQKHPTVLVVESGYGQAQCEAEEDVSLCEVYWTIFWLPAADSKPQLLARYCRPATMDTLCTRQPWQLIEILHLR